MSAIITAAVIVAGAAIYTGEESRKSASKSRRGQEQAQRTSLVASLRDEQLAGQAERKANRRRPDVAGILANEQSASMGPASTMLAGRGGGSKPLLGSKSTLMGT